MIKIKNVARLFFALLVSLFLSNYLIQTCFAEEGTRDLPTTADKNTKEQFSITPVKKAKGKWRIGYYEGGNYHEYHTNLNATIQGLMSLKWIDETELADLNEVTGESLWAYYSENIKSDYLEFVPDGFYTAGWDNEKRRKIKKALISRLNDKKDLDLVLAMGTWAGFDLSRGNHQTPIIVLAASDAVSSGIIKNIHDSGNDFVHARVDPGRYERQLLVFHAIIGFNALGMIYRDDDAGRSYAAVIDVNKVARERGFDVEPCHLESSAKQTDDEQRLIYCFRNLIEEKKVDAIYVTGQKAVNKKTVPIMARIAKIEGIPTFSQSGAGEVKQGLLLSMSQKGFKKVGQFYAETIAKLFNNAKPRKLNQIFADPVRIAINLTTASVIEFYPSLDVLSIADEIYRDNKQNTLP